MSWWSYGKGMHRAPRGMAAPQPAGSFAPSGGQVTQRPDQGSNAPQSVVAPTAAGSTLRARLVIVSGPTGSDLGVFVYPAGTTPALGNPPINWITNSFNDPFGNLLPQTGTGTQSAGSWASMITGAFELALTGITTVPAALKVAGSHFSYNQLQLHSGEASEPGAHESLALLNSSGLGGTLQVLSGADGNTYDTMRITLAATGQTVSSLSSVPVAGLVFNVAVGTYRVYGTLFCTQGAASAQQAVGIDGTATTSVANIGFDVIDTTAGSGTVAWGASELTGMPTRASLGSVGNITDTHTFKICFSGEITFNAAGTFEITASCVTSAADTWTVDAGFLDLMPVSGVTGAGGSGGTNNTIIGSTIYMLPSGDTTGATDTAAVNTALGAYPRVTLLPGTWYTNGPLLVHSLSVLTGSGRGTLVQTAAGFTGSYMVELAAPASTYGTLIEEMTLWPSAASVTGVGGVQLDNTGWANSDASIVNQDPYHMVRHVTVLAAGGGTGTPADGFHFDNNTRELRIESNVALGGSGYGFYLGNGGGSGNGCTDSHFHHNTSAHNFLNGFQILDANNMLTSNKAFGNGWDGSSITSTTAVGFSVAATANKTQLVANSAQQNALHGFDLQGATQVTVTGNDSDSNSAGTGVTTGVGINQAGCSDSAIVANVGAQNLSPGAQAYGIQTAGSSPRTWLAFNTVKGPVATPTSTFHYVSGSGYYLFDGPNIADFTNLNDVRAGLFHFFEDNPITVTTGSTILPISTFGTYPLTSAGNVTGLIVSVTGAEAGGTITLINTTVFTMQFDVPGTSNVAEQGGAQITMVAGAAQRLVWDSGTALWYGG